jgi:hypothetical protein
LRRVENRIVHAVCGAFELSLEFPACHCKEANHSISAAGQQLLPGTAEFDRAHVRSVVLENSDALTRGNVPNADAAIEGTRSYPKLIFSPSQSGNRFFVPGECL